MPSPVLPSVLIKEKIFEDKRSNDNLDLLLDDHVVDDGVHQSEPLAGDVVSVLHSNEDVAAGSGHSQQFRQS